VGQPQELNAIITHDFWAKRKFFISFDINIKVAMERIIKSGYLSDIDNMKLLYYGTIT